MARLLRYIYVWPIIRDHFCPFRYGRERKFNVAHFIQFFIAPAVAAGFTAFKLPAISAGYQGTLLAVFSVVAAVMMGMLPVVQNIVGLFKARETTYEPGELFLFRQQVARLQVLRELYADIGFVVLVLTVALVPILLCQAHPWHWVMACLSGFVYFAGYSTIISFLHVIAGIYFVLNLQADDVSRELAKKAPASPIGGASTACEQIGSD